MLAQFTAWLAQLAKAVFDAAWQFLVDVVIAVVDALAGALVYLVSLIPVPDFMSQGLQSVYGNLDPGIAYLLTASGLPAALAIIGTGYVFRIGRKIATLFQW